MLMWEYKIEKCHPDEMTEEKMDTLGAEGWLLVDVLPIQTYAPTNDLSSFACSRAAYYFKRPKNKLYQDVKDVNAINAINANTKQA